MMVSTTVTAMRPSQKGSSSIRWDRGLKGMFLILLSHLGPGENETNYYILFMSLWKIGNFLLKNWIFFVGKLDFFVEKLNIFVENLEFFFAEKLNVFVKKLEFFLWFKIFVQKLKFFCWKIKDDVYRMANLLHLNDHCCCIEQTR